MNEAAELRRDASPFRIVARGITTQQLDSFLKRAQWAWRYVLERLDIAVEDGWPTDWPAFLPRVIDVAATDTIKIPEMRWDKELIRYSVPAAKLRTGFDSCVAHELTHLLAPGLRQRDHMLREGLAVHIQALFDVESADRSYPTEGDDLHEKTLSLIESVGHRIPLREVEAARLPDTSGPLRQLAYLEEGSFVRFLIGRAGIATYLRVHDGEGYEPVLGCELQTLEREWVSFLGR